MIECPPLAWRGPAIDQLLDLHLRQGHDDVDRLTQTILETLYAITPAGVPIPWETMGDDAPPCLIELRRLVRSTANVAVARRDHTLALKRYHAAATTALQHGSRS